MEDLDLLQSALDKATQRGVFTLQEVGTITNSLVRIRVNLSSLTQTKESVIEEAIKEG
tara:strand:- start:59817 stop:59990 length:174 start_codon:yes stop_codon:yes gene_type:complete